MLERCAYTLSTYRSKHILRKQKPGTDHCFKKCFSESVVAAAKRHEIFHENYSTISICTFVNHECIDCFVWGGTGYDARVLIMIKLSRIFVLSNNFR